MSARSAQVLTVAVTGHRDLLESELPELRSRVRWFLEHLVEEYPDLQLELLSGLAAGADQLVAEEALELGLPVTAVLPFGREEYARDFSDGGAALARLLARCTVVTMPTMDGLDPAANSADRDRQYAQLGQFLSNHCQVLLALWDGKDSAQLGGTASVMRYHLTGVMPGLELTPATPNLLASNENDLAYHVVCSRQRAAGAPEPGLAPLESYWLTGHFGRQSGQHMPFDYDLMLDRLGIFARDLRRYADPIDRESRGLINHTRLPLPSGAGFADDLYARADWLAVHYQKKFTFGLLLSHGLAVVMGLVFIVYSEFIEQWGLALLFMGLFLTGVLFHLLGERREWHRKYLDYRALAEGLRVQVYWNLAGVVNAHSAEFAYDNFLQKQDVDLAWIRHVMRSASLRRDRNSEPDPAWTRWVIEEWVGSEASGQLGYYASKARSRAKTFRRTQRLSQVALWTGIAMAAALAIFARQLTELQAIGLLILMGVLPLIAGVRDTYSHKKADKELIKQYHFMAEVFGNARRLLDDSDDPALRRQVLRAVGNAALEEHAEWLLMHRERPLEHGGI